MDNKSSQTQKDQLWPSVISIFVPLIQLLLVLSISISNILNIKILFFKPEILTLINLLTLFSTLSFIGCFWFWRNYFYSFSIKPPKPDAKFIAPERMIMLIITVGTIISLFFFLSFIFSVVIYLRNQVLLTETASIMIQYISYILFLTTSGFVLYIWISEYIRKKQTFQREDFNRNIMNTLRDYGLIKNPKIKIWKSQFAQGWIGRIIEIEIENKRYVMMVSYDGLEIFDTFTKEQYEESSKKTNQ